MAGEEFADEAEAFFGVAGVTVEGNSTAKTKGSLAVLRQQQQLILHPTSGIRIGLRVP
jgi:hypothetical protein